MNAPEQSLPLPDEEPRARRARARWRIAARAGWLVYAAVLLAAFVVWQGRRPAVETATYARPRPEAGELVDLALLVHGGRVRVSSYAMHENHHPAYLIDGFDKPTTTQKWASSPDDPSPWLEVLLPVDADIQSVRLTLAGQYENASFTLRDYDLTCRDGGGATLARLEVRKNRYARPEHALSFTRARAVRIDFHTAPDRNDPLHMARVFEVEVMGRAR